MPYLIGCDIGTTSVKALAINLDGEIIASSNREYTMFHPHPDWHEQDPAEICKATLECIRSVIRDNASPGQPEGIVFSAAMHSLMVTDQEGKPVTPLMIWADSRSRHQAGQLRSNDAGRRLYHNTGTPVHPMSPLCKLLWMKEIHPELIKKEYKYVGIKAFVMYHLTGQWITDYSIASATGLFNIHTKKWDEAALSLTGITEEQLPLPVSPLTMIPVLHQNGYVPDTTYIIPGASDGCLANLGAGALSGGKMAMTIGTSAAVRVGIHQPFTATDGSTFCYLLDEETYISGGGSNSGGKVFYWALDILFPDVNIQEVTRQVAAIQPGSEHLLFMPYLFGERAPLWDASIRGGFAGLDITHTRAHMMRAVQEGILLNLYMICHQIEQQHAVDVIYANGGFAENKLWVQMLADIFGKPVILNESKEAAAIGAVIMGFRALGHISHYEDASLFHQEKERFYPDEDRHQIYRQVFSDFEKLVMRFRN